MEALDKAQDRLEAVCAQATGPAEKGTFCPTSSAGAGQRGSSSHHAGVLMLHTLPVPALAAAKAGFRAIENHPGGAGQGRTRSAQARRGEVLSRGKTQPGVSPGKVRVRYCQTLLARGPPAWH